MTLNSADIEHAARKLLDHRDRRLAKPVLPVGERLSDLAVGYAIQDAVERILTTERGFPTIGYKIAATNATSREHLKIKGPFWGRLYNSMTSKSPARLPSGIGFSRVVEAGQSVVADFGMLGMIELHIGAASEA
jgi:2-keto-4-pentenoate hydratase